MQHYYGLQSVFAAGVDRAERPYDLDPESNGGAREFNNQIAALQAEAEND